MKIAESIFTHSSLGIAQCDPKTGRFIDANPKMEEITGYSLEELKELTFSDLTHPDDRTKNLEGFKSMLSGESFGNSIEKRYLRKDGKTVWVRVDAFVTEREKNNAPLSTIAFVVDVTLEKEALNQLSASEHRYRALFEQNPLSIQSFSPDGRTLHVNAAWRALWNVPAEFVEEYILKEYNVLNDPQLQAKGVLPYIKKALAGESVKVPPMLYDPKELGKPGRARWLETFIHPVKNEMGKINEIVVIHNDITARKEAEDKRDLNDERLKLLANVSKALSESLDYETTLSAVARLLIPALGDFSIVDICDENQKIYRVATVHTDSAKQRLLDELKEKHPPTWDSPQPGVRAIRSGEPQLMSFLDASRVKDHTRGQEHFNLISEIGIKSHLSVPLIARGRILGAISLGIVTSERQYDVDDLQFVQELAHRAALAIDNALLYKQAQAAIAARDEFLSIASHELKTPITTLKLQVQMTKRAVNPELNLAPSPEKLAKMLNTSDAQVNRLTALVEDLLDVSKIQAGKLSFSFEKVNLRQLTEEVIERFADEAKEANAPLQMDDKNPSLIGYWDRSRIEQVVINLISNALKYAPGKPIQLSLRSDRNGFATLVVQDSGPGIPKDKHSLIFERFERVTTSRNISGLGLGLFIVKKIVTAHHGLIRVESEVDHGSKFIVELPLAQNELPLQ